MDQANARFRGWMGGLLVHAAEHFALTHVGNPTFGWRDRSIGSRARAVDGDRWLRVVTSHSTWASGEFWTGNLDATAVHGVPKPYVLQVHEWIEELRNIRAELMTLVPGRVCSDTQKLHNELDLPSEWWIRTADGARAQLHVIGRLLLRVNGGDYPDLANPLHRHAQHLLAKR